MIFGKKSLNDADLVKLCCSKPIDDHSMFLTQERSFPLNLGPKFEIGKLPKIVPMV
jgi:hypothetical protein